MNETAHYCGVSVGHLYAKVDQYNLEPREFIGKKLYEKAALYQAIYSASKWSRSQSAGVKWVAYLHWRDGAKRFRISIGRLGAREAEEIRSAREAELRHGVRIISWAPLLRDFLSVWLDWYKAEHPTTHNKAKSKLRIIIQSLGHRPIDTLHPIELEAYKTQRLVKDSTAPETAGKEVRCL